MEACNSTLLPVSGDSIGAGKINSERCTCHQNLRGNKSCPTLHGGQAVQEIIDGYKQLDFPNCGGAIDRIYVLILVPLNYSEYIKRKGDFLMQALIDQQGCLAAIKIS